MKLRTTIAAGLILLTVTLASANIISTIDPYGDIATKARTGLTFTGAIAGENDWSPFYQFESLKVGGVANEYVNIHTDFFSKSQPTYTATVSWDFPTGPREYWTELLIRLRAIEVYGEQDAYVLYAMEGEDRFKGSVEIMLDHPITRFYLSGGQTVPDSGTTATLLGMALAGLAIVRRRLC